MSSSRVAILRFPAGPTHISGRISAGCTTHMEGNFGLNFVKLSGCVSGCRVGKFCIEDSVNELRAMDQYLKWTTKESASFQREDIMYQIYWDLWRLHL